MAARLITELDVAKAGAGATLFVDADTVITPSALDKAHRLGVTVEWRAAPGRGLIVARDVERVPRGGRLEIDARGVVTPLAADRARERGVVLVVRTPAPRPVLAEPPQDPASMNPPAAAKADAPCPACDGRDAASIAPRSRLRVDVLRDLFAPAARSAEGCA